MARMSASMHRWGHGAAWVGKLLGLEGMCCGEVDKRRTIFPLKVQKHWSQKPKANRESTNQDNDSTSLYVCLCVMWFNSCMKPSILHLRFKYAMPKTLCHPQTHSLVEGTVQGPLGIAQIVLIFDSIPQEITLGSQTLRVSTLDQDFWGDDQRQRAYDQTNLGDQQIPATALGNATGTERGRRNLWQLLTEGLKRPGPFPLGGPEAGPLSLALSLAWFTSAELLELQKVWCLVGPKKWFWSQSWSKMPLQDVSIPLRSCTVCHPRTLNDTKWSRLAPLPHDSPYLIINGRKWSITVQAQCDKHPFGFNK